MFQRALVVIFLAALGFAGCEKAPGEANPPAADTATAPNAPKEETAAATADAKTAPDLTTTAQTDTAAPKTAHEPKVDTSPLPARVDGPLMEPGLLAQIPADSDFVVVSRGVRSLSELVDHNALLAYPEYIRQLQQLTKTIGLTAHGDLTLGALHEAGIDIDGSIAAFGHAQRELAALVLPLASPDAFAKHMAAAEGFTGLSKQKGLFCESRNSIEQRCVLIRDKYALVFPESKTTSLHEHIADYASAPATSIADAASLKNANITESEDLVVLIQPQAMVKIAMAKELEAAAEFRAKQPPPKLPSGTPPDPGKEEAAPEEDEEAVPEEDEEAVPEEEEEAVPEEEELAKRAEAEAQALRDFILPLESIVMVLDIENPNLLGRATLSFAEGAILPSIFDPKPSKLLSLLDTTPLAFGSVSFHLENASRALEKIIPALPEELGWLLVVVAMEAQTMGIDAQMIEGLAPNGYAEFALEAGSPTPTVTGVIGTTQPAGHAAILGALPKDAGGRAHFALKSGETFYVDGTSDAVLVSSKPDFAAQWQSAKAGAGGVMPKALYQLLAKPGGGALLLNMGALAKLEGPPARGEAPDILAEDPYRNEVPYSDAFLAKQKELEGVMDKLLELEVQYRARHAALERKVPEAVGTLGMHLSSTPNTLELRSMLVPTVPKLSDIFAASYNIPGSGPVKLLPEEQTQYDALMMDMTTIEAQLWEARAATLKTAGKLGDGATTRLQGNTGQLKRRFGPGGFGRGK